MRVLLLSGFFLANLAVAAPALRWDAKEILVEALIGRKPASVHFAFVNEGTAPVHIFSVESDCACTSAFASVQTLAPGARAEIQAEVTGAAEPVERTATLRVVSDDPEASATILVINVRIQDLLTFPDRFIYWKAGEGVEPRVIAGTIPPGRHLKWTSVRSTNPLFQVELLPTEASGQLRLRVTPPAAMAHTAGRVLIHSRDLENGEEFDHVLIVRVL